MSVVSPDPRKLRTDAHQQLAAIENCHCPTCYFARALLSALDALEQAGGGKAESGMTAAQSSVVGHVETEWTQRAWDAALLLRADIKCFAGCGCEEYDYCAVDEWDNALVFARFGELSPLAPAEACTSSADAERSSDTARVSGADTTSDCRQAVAPKASDRPGSVEALEAERDEAAEACAEWVAEERALVIAAEVGRDQANKERDEWRLAAAKLDALKWADPRCYCGSLFWTVAKYGRVTHKHNCPARQEPYCQSTPKGCDSALAGVPGGGRQEQDLGGGAAGSSKGGEA